MTVHLIKLCVGAESITDLAEWQAERLAEKKRARQPQEILHITRSTPARAQDVLSGGSLYWVIKGYVCARQRITELRPVTKNGQPHCALVLDPEIIRVAPRAHRPFQGWRYLDASAAPADLSSSTADMSEKLQRELAAAGLL